MSPTRHKNFSYCLLVIGLLVLEILIISCERERKNAAKKVFNPQIDVISLHYDHAPDRDDGHSAVADRMILQEKFGIKWIRKHIIAVSGAYGLNKEKFQEGSNAVMNAIWSNCGGWLAADKDWDGVARILYKRWIKTIKSEGHVWVKEGGQSDLTAEVVKIISEKNPSINTKKCIHVVQHGNWNENQTTKEALEYVKNSTDYIRISNANEYFNDKDGNLTFANSALKDPVYGNMWKAAFDYLDPNKKVDFSDTGELLYILGIEPFNVDEFRSRYFK